MPHIALEGSLRALSFDGTEIYLDDPITKQISK